MGKLLIVDDDILFREMTQELLEPEGYNLHFAGGGEEALQLAIQHCPDLIMLDLHMEDMDGLEVCRSLRADELMREVPILMITGMRDRDGFYEMLEAGADDIIYKPYDPVELLARVRTIVRLDRHRRLMQERSRFMWMMDQSDDGYIGVNEKHKLTFANPAAREMLGIAEEWSADDPPSISEVIAAKGYITMPEDLFSSWPEDTVSDGVHGYLAQPENNFSKAAWLHVDIPRLPRAHTGEHMVRLRNVTDQVNMQQDMWSFHLVINHKLRTPISGLINGLEMISQRADKLKPEQIATLSSISFRAAQRLQQQIKDVLVFLDSGKHVNTEPANAEALRELIEEIGKDMTDIDLTVKSELPESSKLLRLSAAQVELVIRELLTNAQKFHPEKKPQISISLAEGAEGALEISIEDNGTHLAPDILKKVWLPYYQAEKLVTGEIPGMGLGLAKIATLLCGIGGKYGMSNREDATGVRITLQIPIVKVKLTQTK